MTFGKSSEPSPTSATPAGDATPHRSGKPLLAAAMMVLAAFPGAVLFAAEMPPATIAIAVAGMLAVAAIVLILRVRQARLIGLATASVGVVCYAYLLVRTWPLVQMGAVGPVFGLFPLAGAGLLAVALAVLLMWRPARSS